MPSFKKFDSQNLKLDYPEVPKSLSRKRNKSFFYHIFFESNLHTRRAQDMKGFPPHVSYFYILPPRSISHLVDWCRNGFAV